MQIGPVCHGSEKDWLHPWVAFLIMPLFAFANAGVPFQLSDLGDLSRWR